MDKETERAKAREYYRKNSEKFKAYRRNNYAKNKEEFNRRVIENWKKRRKWVTDLRAERGCERCGTHDFRVLDFHHRDPQRKRFCISSSADKLYKREQVQAELENCAVLCSNCHRILHWEERYGHEEEAS